MVYVQQELMVDEEQARAVVESVAQTDAGNVSSLELVILNARIKEV